MIEILNTIFSDLIDPAKGGFKPLKRLPDWRDVVKRPSDEILEQRVTPEYTITVYKDGVVLYVTGKHHIVMPINNCIIRCKSRCFFYRGITNHSDFHGYIEEFNTDDLLNSRAEVVFNICGDTIIDINHEVKQYKKTVQYDDDIMSSHCDDKTDIVESKIVTSKFFTGLTEKQKEVFILYYVRGNTMVETAEVLGITQPAVSGTCERIENKYAEYAKRINVYSFR